MIKYKLICKDCNNIFDSWFSSSKEYEKLKKRKFKRSRSRIKFLKKNKSKKLSKGISKKLQLSKDDDGNTLIQVSDHWAKHALVNKIKYQKKYNLSIKENDSFGERKQKESTG